MDFGETLTKVIPLVDFEPNRAVLRGFPLIVDLDGTLIKHDILRLQLVLMVLKKPWYLIGFFVLLLTKGIARAKHFAADLALIQSLHALPTNDLLVTKMNDYFSRGGEVILCTGASWKVADEVAAAYPSITKVFASREYSLTGRSKASFLASVFGEGGFYYVGNSRRDELVYAKSALGIRTQANLDSPKLKSRKILENVYRQLRVKHWTKNGLLFLPLVAAHELTSGKKFLELFFYFLAFGFMASGTYVINDLLDIESDMKHSTKKFRPAASGQLPVELALMGGCVLVALGLIAQTAVSIPGATIGLVYLVLTLSYSYKIKRIFGLDIVALAVLYSLRILAGMVVSGLPISVWMLSFTFMMFFSMSSVKRFTEVAQAQPNEIIHGRDYIHTDRDIVSQLGIASGVAGVLVYILYATSAETSTHYHHPIFLLSAVPVLFYWVAHLWRSAHRQLIDIDPIDWALRDRASQLSFFSFLMVVIITGLLNKI